MTWINSKKRTKKEDNIFLQKALGTIGTIG